MLMLEPAILEYFDLIDSGESLHGLHGSINFKGNSFHTLPNFPFLPHFSF